MTSHTVTPLRPRSRCSDAAALNDIHALLTTSGQAPAGLLTDIGLILARAGRPLIPVRDIEITSTETAHGWPVACAQSGDASVFIRQQPAGPGLLIEIHTKTAAEHDALTVTLDGQSLHPVTRRGLT
jgi:hypothetical protein